MRFRLVAVTTVLGLCVTSIVATVPAAADSADPLVHRLAGGGVETADGAPATRSALAIRSAAGGPDGTHYVAGDGLVRRIDPDGTVRTVAGKPGQLALNPQVGMVHGSEGLTFVDAEFAGTAPTGGAAYTWRLRRLHEDGTMTTVAGGGTEPVADGQQATSTAFGSMGALVRQADGSLVVSAAKGDAAQLVRIAVDGTTTVIAGGGSSYYGGNEAALESRLNQNLCLVDDPIGERLIVVDGERLRALTPDGRFTQLGRGSCPLAILPDRTILTGALMLRPDGSIRRLVLPGSRTSDDQPLSQSRMLPWQYLPQSDGALHIVDGGTVLRRIDTVPVPAGPGGTGTVTAAPGPVSVTLTIPRPADPQAKVVVRADPGTVAPRNAGLGSEVWSGTAGTGTGPITAVIRKTWGPGGLTTLTGGQPYAFSVFVGAPDDVTWSVPESVVAVPEVDTTPPPPVSGVRLSSWIEGQMLTWSAAPSGSDRQRVVVTGNSSRPPLNMDDGDVPLGEVPDGRTSTTISRYEPLTPLHLAVYAVDWAGNVSEPVRLTIPAATLSPTLPGPVDGVGWESKPLDRRLEVWFDRQATWNRYALGDVPPATPSDGIAACVCTGGWPSGYGTFADGVAPGQHVSFSIFTRTGDGLHYSRRTRTIVMGTNSTPDRVGLTGTSATTGTRTLTARVQHSTYPSPRVGTPVELWSRVRPSATWTRVATSVTGSAGTTTFTVLPQADTLYQVRSGITDPLAPPQTVSGTILERVVRPGPRTMADFDGDGRSDLSVWRPGNANWLVPGVTGILSGAPTDVPVTGHFDGDGRTDLAVWRPSTGVWYVHSQPVATLGGAGDIPVPADYSGDGTADPAVYRPSTATWYVAGRPALRFGLPGDVPLPADVNGDGRSELVLYRPSTSTFYVHGQPGIRYGLVGDLPLVADFNGDNRADLAVYRRSNGTWYVRGQSTAQWGRPGDVPLVGDFNGDNRTDVAIYRPSDSSWRVRGALPQVWGVPGDLPLPLPAAVRRLLLRR